jgi:hypothetical protein
LLDRGLTADARDVGEVPSVERVNADRPGEAGSIHIFGAKTRLVISLRLSREISRRQSTALLFHYRRTVA